MRDLPLNRLTSTHAHLVPLTDIGLTAYHVDKPFTLIQAAGYLKHTRAGSNKAVYFRGQERLHATMAPSLFRKLERQAARDTRAALMNQLLSSIKKNKVVLQAVPEEAREAVLQHYGLRTRWLDVVDNVWIALWFACHKAHATGRHGEFLHFERRVPRHEKEEERFAYIVLIEGANVANGVTGPGYFKDADSEVIDLRVAVPSHFIRPHLQHGLVVRALDLAGTTSIDFSKLVAGVIRVHLSDALDWLGSGDFLNVHALFPPPKYDFGYAEILQHIKTSDQFLGAIHQIGA